MLSTLTLPSAKLAKDAGPQHAKVRRWFQIQPILMSELLVSVNDDDFVTAVAEILNNHDGHSNYMTMEIWPHDH